MRENTKDLYDEAQGRVIPSVVDKKWGRSIQYDILSRCLRDRVVMFYEGFEDAFVVITGMQLMYLDTQDPGKEITLIIQSPGGSVYALNFIKGIIAQISSPIKTVVYGFAASCGLSLFLMGDRRVMGFNARLMGHQVSSGGRGYIRDLQINMRDAEYLYSHSCILISAQARIEQDGKMVRYFPTEEYVRKVWHHGDCYISAVDALTSGIATEILQPTKHELFHQDFLEFMYKNRSPAMVEYEKNRFGQQLSMPAVLSNMFDTKKNNNKKTNNNP